jgi:hypothetical protein
MKPKVTYQFSRLCFKADIIIEPLADDDQFQVDTPEGSFVMTKLEFYRAFPNVVGTRSYKRGRVYHYPRTPQKATCFLQP